MGSSIYMMNVEEANRSVSLFYIRVPNAGKSTRMCVCKSAGHVHNSALLGLPVVPTSRRLT